MRLENASSFEDEAEGFEKSLLPQVIRLAAGEGQYPSPESEGFFESGLAQGGLSSL